MDGQAENLRRIEPVSLCAFAFVLGTLEWLFGLPLLVFPAATAQWLIALTKQQELYRLVAAFFLVLCVVVLADDMSLEVSLAGLLRLVAWIGVLKSLIICWWPSWHARLAERLLLVPRGQRLLGVLATAVGALFFWAGAALR